MKIRATVGKDSITFSSERSRMLFFQRFEGKPIVIEPDEEVTAEMRRYFEGCLVPVTFYVNPRSGWVTFKDAREALKFEFLPHVKFENMQGHVVESVPSTTEFSKERFRAFVDSIVHWLMENYQVPEDYMDSSAYLNWRDTGGPDSGDGVYPPLKRLKEVYDREKPKYLPVWKSKTPPAKETKDTPAAKPSDDW